MKERVIVIIDGSNFYHKIKNEPFNIKGSTHFDYRGMVNWLVGGGELVTCSYYVGAISAAANDLKSQQLRRQQQKLFRHLTGRYQGFVLKRGYLLKNDDKFHEKGVDVRMAVDLLVGAYENTYDKAILLSSDTDLLPAITQARSLGKIIEYVGFINKPSIALKKYASKSRLLKVNDLKEFIR